MNQFILVVNEERVRGFYDKDELDGAVLDLTSDDDRHVYMLNDVLKEVDNTIELDTRDKQSLKKKLKQDEIDFSYTTDFEVVIGEVEPLLEYEV